MNRSELLALRHSTSREMDAIYILWLREVKRFFRLRSRVVGSLGMPFFLLIFLGLAPVSFPGMPTGRYINLLAPGIVGMVLLFSSMGAGTSVLWDREFGFLKEIMVAPIRRSSIVLGKIGGGVTTSLFQGLLILALALPLGLKLTGISTIPSPTSLALGFSLSLAFMLLIGVTFVGLGLAFASKMRDIHGFQLIWNFLVFPVFLLSGALIPVDMFPGWLEMLAYVDPLTYGVDGLRGCLVGYSHFSLWFDFLVLVGCGALTVGLGSYLFSRVEMD